MPCRWFVGGGHSVGKDLNQLLGAARSLFVAVEGSWTVVVAGGGLSVEVGRSLFAEVAEAKKLKMADVPKAAPVVAMDQTSQ